MNITISVSTYQLFKSVEYNLLINLNMATNIFKFYIVDKKKSKKIRRRFRSSQKTKNFYDDGFVDSRNFKSLEITIFLV